MWLVVNGMNRGAGCCEIRLAGALVSGEHPWAFVVYLCGGFGGCRRVWSDVCPPREEKRRIGGVKGRMRSWPRAIMLTGSDGVSAAEDPQPPRRSRSQGAMTRGAKPKTRQWPACCWWIHPEETLEKRLDRDIEVSRTRHRRQPVSEDIHYLLTLRTHNHPAELSHGQAKPSAVQY